MDEKLPRRSPNTRTDNTSVADEKKVHHDRFFFVRELAKRSWIKTDKFGSILTASRLIFFRMSLLFILKHLTKCFHRFVVLPCNCP